MRGIIWMLDRICLGSNVYLLSVYFMIIRNSVSLNIETKLEKGADFMKIIMCIIGMMAGAVLLEQVVHATKIMRVEDRKV